MTDQQPQEQDLYNIVIVGDMNPKIHHPAWYEHIGLLSEKEASDVQNLVCTPPMSQFEAAGLTVICALNRWEIRTSSIDDFDRAIKIATIVFGTLTHTPVSVFGFNFNSLRQTEVTNVAEILGQKVASLQLGLREEGVISAEVKQMRVVDDCRITTILRSSSNGTQVLLIGINFQYEIKDIVAPNTQFDLSPLIRNRFENDRTIASEQFVHVVQTFGQEL